MDKIEKLLRTLSAKEQEAVLLLMQQVKLDYRKIPGVKALQGMKGWFRVRMRQYRIIFFMDPKTKKVEIRRVTRKNERSYDDLS